MPKRFLVPLAFIVVLCLVAAVPARAADVGGKAKGDKPAVVKVSAKDILEVKKAIDPVLKEGREAFTPKDPKSPGKLREKSDFFEGGKLPEGLTADMFLAALLDKMSTDPRVDAYVKWEMLSGLPSPFPPEMVERALNAYRAAPAPLANPGLDHQGLQAKLANVGMQNRKALDPVNAEFEKMLAKYEASNDPILKYRDELKSRLPPTVFALAAELEDLYARVETATEAKPMYDNVREKLKTWSTTANPREISYLIPGVQKVIGTVKSEKYKAYYRVIWLEDKQSKGMKWDSKGAFEPKGYDELVTDLKDAARTSPPVANGSAGGAGKMDMKK